MTTEKPATRRKTSYTSVTDTTSLVPLEVLEVPDVIPLLVAELVAEWGDVDGVVKTAFVAEAIGHLEKAAELLRP